MDIVEVIPSHIYSIQYDGEDVDEYHRLFNREWNDVLFLKNFFEAHEEFTHNKFWSIHKNEPEEAAKEVIIDANLLETDIKERATNAENGTEPDLDDMFEPLNGKYIYEINLLPMKGYGIRRPSFLRLYAIKMDSNLYLIVYGGIKLKKEIQTSPILKENVFKKIDSVRAYLISNGIAEGDDLIDE